MNTNTRKFIYWLSFLIGVSIFIQQLISGLDLFRDLTLLANSILLLVAALIFTTLSNGVRTLGWIKLMASLGYEFKWRRVVSGFALSLIPRYIPGGFWGYLSRSEWLFQTLNLPYKISMFGSYIEAAIAVTSALALIGLNLAWGSRLYALLVVIPLGIIGLWLVVYFYLANRIKRDELGGELVQGNDFDYSGKHIIVAGILYSLSLVMNSTSILFISRSFDLSPQIGLLDATMNFNLAWLVGFLIFFIPAGLGVREFSLSRILSGNYNLRLHEASAIAVTTRVLIVLGEFLWLLISIISGKRSTSENEDPESPCLAPRP